MKLRKILLFISFFLLPITLNYFSPVLIVQASLEKTFTVMHVIYGIMLLSSMFLGGLWCSYICPFGALQETLPGKGRTPKSFHSRFPNLKYITGFFWILMILLPVLLHGFNNSILFYHMEDTKVTLDSMHGLILYYIITGSIILITAFLGKRFWCRYLCPMYILNYIGMRISQLFKLPSLKINVDHNRCTQCGKCKAACQMGLDVPNPSAKKQHIECIQCGECISNCKSNAIKRTWKSGSKH